LEQFHLFIKMRTHISLMHQIAVRDIVLRPLREALSIN
jgi:hypothetical protein